MQFNAGAPINVGMTQHPTTAESYVTPIPISTAIGVTHEVLIRGCQSNGSCGRWSDPLYFRLTSPPPTNLRVEPGPPGPGG